MQLHDKRVIVVKRTAKGKSLGEIGGPGGWEQSEMTLDIDDTDAAFKPPVWRFAYVPILLDYDDITKEWFVVATFYTCVGWYQLGRPDLPYIEYRARSGGWEGVPLAEGQVGKKTNLLADVSSGGESPLVTLEEKKKRRRDTAERFRSIISKWHTTC